MKIEKIKEIIENLDIENPSEKDIEAIEEEWITDPLQREELSMLRWEDNGDIDIDDLLK